MTRDDTTRDHRLHALLGLYFEAAGSCSAVDRSAWIAAHPDLAPDLASFFAGQDRLSGLLRPPESPLPDFGDYAIVREIARGGMGVVYEAHQTSLNRPVALKMILDGSFASADALRRFRIEAESAASLDHPHIVPIYEVGDYDGRPFLSMKLLPGGSLADRLADFAPDPRASTALLSTIARAVHHAHQRGLLHRDLKPSNVLLDAHGQPHVADFGLARRIACEETFTDSDAMIGSPPYMAPEQTRGDSRSLTVSTDVYGLGSILYALLTGRPPFRGDSALETIEKVRDQPPEPPSRENPLVDRDLDTICLHCLAKDPSRRYSSASDLADDLDRWLSGHPIAARPVGRWERSWRWCRRNPVVAVLAGSIATLLAVSLGGLLLALVVIDGERSHAEIRSVEARRAVDEMYTEFAEKWLSQERELEPIQRDFLLKALRFYEEFSRGPTSDPSARQEFGMALLRVGKIQARLDKLPESEAALRRAASILEPFPIKSSHRADHRDQLALVYHELGLTLLKETKLSEAESMLGRSLALRERIVAEHPDRGVCRRDLAWTCAILGNVHLYQGKLPRAEAMLRRAVALSETLSVDVPDRHESLQRCLGDLGMMICQQGRLEEGEPFLRRAMTAQEAVVARDPADLDARQLLAKLVCNVAETQLERKHPADAEAGFGRAVDLAKGLVAELPDLPSYRDDLVVFLVGRARASQDLGRSREAEEAARDAIRIELGFAPPERQIANRRNQLADCYSLLANVLWDGGRHAEALKSEDESGRLFEGLVREHPDADYAGFFRANLATATLRLLIDPAVRDVPEAIRRATRCVELAPDYPQGWNLLGLARCLAGEWQPAIEAMEKGPGINPATSPYKAFALSVSHAHLGLDADARRFYDLGALYVAKTHATDPIIETLRTEAESLLDLGRRSPPEADAVGKP